MSLRGRPRKPTKLRLVEGNRSRRPLPVGEPEPPAGLPDKPKHIAKDPIASAEWERICSLTVLKNARVLTVQDGPVLEATCMAYSWLRAAADILREDGLTYETTNTVDAVVMKPRPEAALAKSFLTEYRAFLTHFGLSPATRGKVTRLDEEQEADPAAGYLE